MVGICLFMCFMIQREKVAKPIFMPMPSGPKSGTKSGDDAA